MARVEFWTQLLAVTESLIDFGCCCQNAYSVLLQSDGKIITVGYPNTESSDSDFLLARLKTNGALDATFVTGGKVRTSIGNLNDGANGALLQPDGRIVAVGFHPTASRRFSEFAAVRYLGGASVTAGTRSVSGSPTFAGNTMTVNLTGVTDVQKISVTLTAVTSSFGEVLPETALSVNMLTGDVTGDKTVDNSDATLTRGQIGAPVTSANFREDVNVTGTITTAGSKRVKSLIGDTLP
jgi:uncharacterized delta-60 repeat protein